jgi:nucleoside-diphosphate-sugar epimerase
MANNLVTGAAGFIGACLANVDKARRRLSWQPEVGLEEGIGRLADWYTAEREWARETIKP